MSNIFSSEHINFEHEPLFFGSGRNVARLDLPVEQTIVNFTRKQRGQFWMPSDISLTKDASDYDNLSPELKDLYLKNLKFQTLLDSVATRTVAEVFLPITTSPQLEDWWVPHAFFESIHSFSYAEIVKALPINASRVFDDIMINDNILNRGSFLVDQFNDTIMHNAQYQLSGSCEPTEEHKKSLIKSLYALNILEAVLFQSSFITSFAFADNGLMDGSGRIISLISKDEKLHMAVTIYLINKLRNDPDWKYLFIELEPEIIDMYLRAKDADYAWIDYLFEDGARLLGISSAALKSYADWNTSKAMKSIGLPVNFDAPDKNPCSWATKYTNTGDVQTAQMETDNINYLISALDRSITTQDWSNIGE